VPADDNQGASQNQRAPQLSRSRKLLSQNVQVIFQGLLVTIVSLFLQVTYVTYVT
jgi:hypothetical protein